MFQTSSRLNLTLKLQKEGVIIIRLFMHERQNNDSEDQPNPVNKWFWKWPQTVVKLHTVIFCHSNIQIRMAVALVTLTVDHL